MCTAIPVFIPGDISSGVDFLLFSRCQSNYLFSVGIGMDQAVAFLFVGTGNYHRRVASNFKLHLKLHAVCNLCHQIRKGGGE